MQLGCKLSDRNLPVWFAVRVEVQLTDAPKGPHSLAGRPPLRVKPYLDFRNVSRIGKCCSVFRNCKEIPNRACSATPPLSYVYRFTETRQYLRAHACALCNKAQRGGRSHEYHDGLTVWINTTTADGN